MVFHALLSESRQFTDVAESVAHNPASHQRFLHGIFGQVCVVQKAFRREYKLLAQLSDGLLEFAISFRYEGYSVFIFYQYNEILWKSHP